MSFLVYREFLRSVAPTAGDEDNHKHEDEEHRQIMWEDGGDPRPHLGLEVLPGGIEAAHAVFNLVDPQRVYVQRYEPHEDRRRRELGVEHRAHVLRPDWTPHVEVAVDHHGDEEPPGGTADDVEGEVEDATQPVDLVQDAHLLHDERVPKKRTKCKL